VRGGQARGDPRGAGYGRRAACGVGGKNRRRHPHEVADQPQGRARSGAARRRLVVFRVHAGGVPHRLAHRLWSRLLRRRARDHHRQGQCAALASSRFRRRHAGRGRGAFRAARGGTEAAMTDPMTVIDPAHGREQEGLWTRRLVLFLGIVAGLSPRKGLYHWAGIAGTAAPPGEAFEATPLPWQAATVFFAVIDLVAAVGLWLAAAWGGVVWLTAAISMAGVELLFPQIFG